MDLAAKRLFRRELFSYCSLESEGATCVQGMGDFRRERGGATHHKGMTPTNARGGCQQNIFSWRNLQVLKLENLATMPSPLRMREPSL